MILNWSNRFKGKQYTNETKRVFVINKWNVDDKSGKDSRQDVEVLVGRIGDDRGYDQERADDDNNDRNEQWDLETN